jgi:phosphocarrier protein FPr
VVNLANRRGPANATSIFGLAILGVRQGHTLQVTASGLEAEAAQAALAADNFGDADQAAEMTGQAGAAVDPAAVPPAAQQAADLPFWPGLAASPGIELGPARLLRTTVPNVPTHSAADPEAEWQKLEAALDKTRGQIQGTGQAVARRAAGYAAAIFETHRLFLNDEALLAPGRRAINAGKLNAAAAWQLAVEGVAASYRALDDPYLRGRAAGATGVGRQVLGNLLGGECLVSEVGEPGILIAADLAPAGTALLDPQRVLGIAAAFGGPTSNSASLARTIGIPAALGLGEVVQTLADGTPVLLDGDTGRVWTNPTPALQADYGRRATTARATEATARSASAGTAVTRDGRRAEVFANIGAPVDARAAVEAGAEGVGLFRTEVLFFDRRTAPDEDEQLAAYHAAAEVLGQRPLTISTLDVGGDKPLPYVDMGTEPTRFSAGARFARVWHSRTSSSFNCAVSLTPPPSSPSGRCF